MLPFSMLVQVKIRCPHCGRAEARLRTSTRVGVEHRCPHCGRTYRVSELLPLTSPTRRPPNEALS